MDDFGQFTAIGFCSYSGYNGSFGTNSQVKEYILELMTTYLGDKPNYIALMKNGMYGPVVVESWIF
jgi:hypothetical protein